MKLVDMKMSPKEAKAELMPSAKEGPRYPWGLQLNLDEEILDKLKVVDLPAVGETYTLTATCEVTGANSSETQGGGKRRSLSLQITKMAPLADDEGKKDAKDVLYSGTAKE